MSKVAVVVGFTCFFLLALFGSSVADGTGSSSSFYDFDSKAEIPGSASSMLQYVTDDERQSAKEYIDICHNRPRYTLYSSNWSFTQREARLGLYDDPSKLEAGDFIAYGESILLAITPVALIALIFIPGAIIYYLLRCCTCGKYKPTRKFCGGDPMEKDWIDGVDGYKTDTVVGLQVAACLASAVVVVGAVLVEIGNRSVTENFDGAVTYANKTVKSLVGLLNETLDTAAYLQQEFSDFIQTGDFVSFLESARSVGAKLEDYDDKLNEYYPKVNEPRQLVLMIMMIVPCVAVVFLLLGAFIGWPAFTCTSIVLSCISIPVCLVLFVLHYPIGSLVSDTCYFIDGATDVHSPDYIEYLASIYRCDDNSPIGNITSSLDNAIETVVSFFCDNVTKVCNYSEVPCDVDFDGEVLYKNVESITCPLIDCSHIPEECNESTLLDTMLAIRVYNYYISCYDVTAPPNCRSTNTEVCAVINGTCGSAHDMFSCDTDYTIDIPYYGEFQRQYPLICGYVDGNSTPISIEECADKCSFDEIKSAAKLLKRFRGAIVAIMDLVLNTIRPFLRCSTVVSILYNVQDFTCVKVVIFLRYLTSGSIAVAVGLVALVVIGTLGQKRFNRKYRFRFVPVVDDEDDDVCIVEMDEKPLHSTVVEYNVDEGESEEDVSRVEVYSDDDD